MGEFSRRLGGGVGGRPRARRSLGLASRAAELLRDKPDREFHVVRTGGVGSGEDLRRSAEADIALVQWYTGYFEAFARHGHGLYRELLIPLLVS